MPIVLGSGYGGDTCSGYTMQQKIVGAYMEYFVVILKYF